MVATMGRQIPRSNFFKVIFGCLRIRNNPNWIIEIARQTIDNFQSEKSEKPTHPSPKLNKNHVKSSTLCVFINDRYSLIAFLISPMILFCLFNLIFMLLLYMSLLFSSSVLFGIVQNDEKCSSFIPCFPLCNIFGFFSKVCRNAEWRFVFCTSVRRCCPFFYFKF